jgi:hypothetical protein
MQCLTSLVNANINSVLKEGCLESKRYDVMNYETGILNEGVNPGIRRCVIQRLEKPKMKKYR